MFSAHNLNLNRVQKHYIEVKLFMSTPFQNKSAELLLTVAENLDIIIIIMKEILLLQKPTSVISHLVFFHFSSRSLITGSPRVAVTGLK